MASPSDKYNARIEELVAQYGAAAAAISTALAAVAAGSAVGGTGAIPAMRTRVAAALGSLLSASVVWINETIPDVYSDGAAAATAAIASEATPLIRPGAESLPPRVDPLESAIHREAIEAAMQELAGALYHAINGIGVTANARLEEIRRVNIARALAQDSPLGNALDQQMAADMADAGITFRDRAGREWNAESYARMVLRTHVASILNIGHINAGIEMGSRYVRVFDGGPGDVDEPCRIANGQVWHIAVAAANLLEHPHCRRSFAALDPEYAGKVDRDIERVAA